jgi:hypothetical protein
LLALPPLALLAVLAALGVSYARVIQVIIGVGIASPGFWGGLAGHRAGLTGLRLVLCVAGGLGLGRSDPVVGRNPPTGHQTVRALTPCGFLD